MTNRKSASEKEHGGRLEMRIITVGTQAYYRCVRQSVHPI